MRITVECSWEVAGAITLDGGELAMPPLPDEPGVYQWVFRHDGRERRYVGEAANLRERFVAYRLAGTDRSTNGRMNARARRVLASGGEVAVLTATDARLERDGRPHPLDLGSKHGRCLVENAALVEVLAAVGEVVNDKGYGKLREDPVLG